MFNYQVLNKREILERFLRQFYKHSKIYKWLILPFFALFLLISREFIITLQKIYKVNLIFYEVLEPLIVLIKTSVYLTALVFLPLVIRNLINASTEILDIKTKRLDSISFVLYLSGVIFCAIVTIPFGLNFFMSFESETLRPMISVTNFVDFTLLLLIIFGILFQLPIIILLLVKLDILKISTLKHNRKLAFFIITIISAIITPTTDIINMLLMILPLTLLYELGIIISNAYLKQ